MLGTRLRLGLAGNIVTLLKLHDNLRMGRIDEEDLGWKIQLSSAHNDALGKAIFQCNKTMITKPSKQKSVTGLAGSA